VISFRDITAEQEQEEQLRLLAEERRHLLMEMNHRVKNNLYTVEALANLERSDAGKDKEEALQAVISRVRAISLVHRKLYSSGEFGAVNARSYLQELAQALVSAYSGPRRSWSIDCTAESISLPPKRITALGLITSELITNTVKHAATAGETRIYLSLRRRGRRAVLDYRDEGPGLPAGVRSAEELKQGTGMRLIGMLAKDLEGELRLPGQPPEETGEAPGQAEETPEEDRSGSSEEAGEASGQAPGKTAGESPAGKARAAGGARFLIDFPIESGEE
jgi:two-component sensor histidine kinase